jgi:hypothetical protein
MALAPKRTLAIVSDLFWIPYDQRFKSFLEAFSTHNKIIETERMFLISNTVENIMKRSGEILQEFKSHSNASNTSLKNIEHILEKGLMIAGINNNDESGRIAAESKSKSIEYLRLLNVETHTRKQDSVYKILAQAA